MVKKIKTFIFGDKRLEKIHTLRITIDTYRCVKAVKEYKHLLPEIIKLEKEVLKDDILFKTSRTLMEKELKYYENIYKELA